MNAEINQVRTELLNVMAEAGRAALHFDTMSAAALAAIPNTDPQQYVIAGTPPMIAKILPAVDVGSPVSTAVGEPVTASYQLTISGNDLMALARRLIAEDLDDCDEEFLAGRAHGIGSLHAEILGLARLAAPTQVSAPQASAAQEVRAVPDDEFEDWGSFIRSAGYIETRPGHFERPTSTSTAPAAMDHVRNRVLEEAAKVADEHNYGPCGEYDFSYGEASAKADDRAEQIASSIRALKTSQPSLDEVTGAGKGEGDE